MRAGIESEPWALWWVVPLETDLSCGNFLSTRLVLLRTLLGLTPRFSPFSALP